MENTASTTTNTKEKKQKANLISGTKIKYYMNSNNFTAEEMALKLGINKRTYFYKLSGETEFTGTELALMTQLFECTLQDLQKDEDELRDIDIEKINAILN